MKKGQLIRQLETYGLRHFADRQGYADPRTGVVPAAKVLAELYTIQELSVCKIAKMFDVSRTAVTELLKKYEIPLRDVRPDEKFRRGVRALGYGDDIKRFFMDHDKMTFEGIGQMLDPPVSAHTVSRHYDDEMRRGLRRKQPGRLFPKFKRKGARAA